MGAVPILSASSEKNSSGGPVRPVEIFHDEHQRTAAAAAPPSVKAWSSAKELLRYAKGVTAADALRYVGAPPALLLPYPASTGGGRFLAETCGNIRQGWFVPAGAPLKGTQQQCCPPPLSGGPDTVTAPAP